MMKLLATALALILLTNVSTAMECYSGTGDSILTKECPFGTGSCYVIRYDSGDLEKGCDAIGCPSAMAKAKIQSGTYSCCSDDNCNDGTPALRQPAVDSSSSSEERQ